jgi:hypothetical protein
VSTQDVNFVRLLWAYEGRAENLLHAGNLSMFGNKIISSDKIENAHMIEI